MRSFVLLILLIAVAASLSWTGPATGAPKPTPKPASNAAPAVNPAVAALAKLSGPAFDAAFMRELIPVHEEAVEIAMAATLNADHPELLQWNQVMIDRKSNQVKQMLAWLQAAGASPGRRNASVVTEPVKRMRSLQGAALEKVYLPMIAAHMEQSVALARLAAEKASRSEVKSMAQAVVATETQDVTRVRGWLKTWYP